jgi:hypothetical protein
MEAAINAFATILREMDARISALEATKVHENPVPVPVPEVPAPVTEELFPLDNYGPDWIQDYLTHTITAVTDAGKPFVFVSEATYRRVIGTSPEVRPDGTERKFRNATGGQVEIVLPGVAEPLLILQPGESGSIVFAENAWKNPVALPPTTEVITNLDNYGGDWVQDYMHVLVSEITDTGKTAVFTYEQDYPHQALCNPESKPDGTERKFRNAGVAPLKVRLHGTWQTLLVLQPGESGSITCIGGRWIGRDMYPEAWASLPTGDYTAIRRQATEEEQNTFASEGIVIEITGADGQPVSTQSNYVWYETTTGKVGAACNNERFFISCDPANAPISAVTAILISAGGVDPSDAGVTFRVLIA